MRRHNSNAKTDRHTRRATTTSYAIRHAMRRNDLPCRAPLGYAVSLCTVLCLSSPCVCAVLCENNTAQTPLCYAVLRYAVLLSARLPISESLFLYLSVSLSLCPVLCEPRRAAAALRHCAVLVPRYVPRYAMLCLSVCVYVSLSVCLSICVCVPFHEGEAATGRERERERAAAGTALATRLYLCLSLCGP